MTAHMSPIITFLVLCESGPLYSKDRIAQTEEDDLIDSNLTVD